MLIDTHCHLDFEWFDDDRAAVVARAVAAGVRQMIVPALDPKNNQAVLSLVDQYPQLYAAVGIHPNTPGWQDAWLEDIRLHAQHPKAVAVGEIGLDYYWDKVPHPIQHQMFSAQLFLAAELELPVIVHNREASQDILRLLTASPLNGRPNPGVLHSFSADWETAAAALDMGFYLGFTGPLTFKKAADLRDIARRVPGERLLVETDAPFLTPHPYRGKRNEPANVSLIAEKMAEIRGVETAVIHRQTSQNARRLFSKLAVVS